jgi:hypothetical protein
MNAIRKFNKYCTTLETLYKPEWDIPLPELLPTQLAVLQDSSTLMEDVWIMPMDGQVPRWLEDVDVHEGIRAVLKMDRCLEERRCLGLEADNLCRWFGRELSVVEVALATPSSKSFIKCLLAWLNSPRSVIVRPSNSVTQAPPQPQITLGYHTGIKFAF